MVAFQTHKSKNTAKKAFARKVSLLGTISAAMILAGCFGAEFEKHEAPITSSLIKEMARINVDKRDAIFIRIFKKEAELEVWKKTSNGRYALLKTYEICAWSGELGPKFKEGDRQAPEGFYKVSPAQMNPNSSFHLSFNLGFPNSYDKSHERTGSFLMVHGACSSAGCYSMEDEQIEEIYALAREAFLGGQEKFQVHAFPFRMTAENMALFRDNEFMPFWRTLKVGYEHFELTKVAPKVDACNRGYIFNAVETDGGNFNANNECPAYEVPSRLAAAVDLEIKNDRAQEEAIAAQWTTPRDRKHAELLTKLKIEKERVGKFEDRGLAYSSHQKRRILEIQAALVKLGYTPDGSLPDAAAPSVTTIEPVSPAQQITPNLPIQRPPAPTNAAAAEQTGKVKSGA
ncbi:MAG: murein L,D-transpeptidase family protein [Hyphomicrobiales bacterium]